MFRIFGPPGTGKTTRLLDMVDQSLAKGTPPSSIAFLAFTKKAATEPKERASTRFGLDSEKDLPYFRTLHSLAYQCVGMKKEQMMQREHFQELAVSIGVDLSNSQDMLGPDDLGSTGQQHPILSLINLARLRRIDLKTAYNESTIDHSWHEVQYVDTAYSKYKKVNDMYDFTDLLDMFIEHGHTYCPKFNMCFLDEAQDLSPMQWEIAHILDTKSERMYAAGDDDQAIYRWNGAEVEHFIKLDGPSEVLEQSYRIPKSVYDVATSISRRIHTRYTKVYKSREELGSVNYIAQLDDLDMSEGSWLVLAQARYMLNDAVDTIRSKGILYVNHNGHRSISEKASLAINGYTQLTKGQPIYGHSVRAIYDYMSGERIKRGFKKTEFDELSEYSMQDLRDNFGLQIEDGLLWHEAMDKLPSLDRAYITALLRRGEKFNGPPRVKLSTIHGSKGGEADNVVVFTDLTWAALHGTRDYNKESIDDLLRVLYVAVTRARKNLYFVDPEEMQRSFYEIWQP